MNRRSVLRQEAVLAALGDARRFVSAHDVHARLAGSVTPMSLSSVYRSLRALHHDVLVERIRGAHGQILYRLRSRASESVLICRDCGLAIPLDTERMEEWARRVCAENAFAFDSLTLGLSGRCAMCERRLRDRKRMPLGPGLARPPSAV